MEPPSLINPGRVAKYEYRMSILLPVVERYANSYGGSPIVTTDTTDRL